MTDHLGDCVTRAPCHHGASNFSLHLDLRRRDVVSSKSWSDACHRHLLCVDESQMSRSSPFRDVDLTYRLCVGPDRGRHSGNATFFPGALLLDPCCVCCHVSNSIRGARMTMRLRLAQPVESHSLTYCLRRQSPTS